MQKLLSVKVSKRYQVALPSQARRHLKIEAGDRLLVDAQDGMLILLPYSEDHAERLLGLHKEVWTEMDANEYLHQERQSWKPSNKE